MSTTERDAELIYAITHQGEVPEPPEWWRGAVYYEVYVHSFKDTTGSGMGDIPGVTQKLDYLRDLGIDGIWLSPFYASPQTDNGYDVSDFRAVHPPFGTLGDVQELIDAAHARGLKIMFDQILGHTSEEHPWFEESRSSRDNPKADWYVWADPAPDGGPPNNWISSFGGRAWRWEPRRAQFVYRPFLESQPALNLFNPDVLDEMCDNLRFWLDMGVDGFRIDAIQCLGFDRELRSNPPARSRENPSVGGGANNPFKQQIHLFDRDVPEAIPILHRIRAVADEYTPQRVLIGELADVDSSRLAPKYTVDQDRLHAVYDFDLINRADTMEEWTGMIDIRSRLLVPGLSMNVFTNHDSERSVSALMPKACEAGRERDAAKLLLFLQCTLAGGTILFQGEELGLEQPELDFDEIKDPWAKALWPDFTGRDGVRCPLPWESGAKNCGFSESDAPWHEVPEAYCEKSVDIQEADPDSVLHFVRRLLRWRRDVPILRTAPETILTDTPLEAIVFEREKGGTSIFCAANFGLDSAEVTLPRSCLKPQFANGDFTLDKDRLTLAPLSCVALA
ncbi:alpha-amylase family glycosyl hydrolase [Profundibacterium mesophilum]|uniref:Alpha-glucosidase n=1 Tax=Profundibacterium mesophilum KAUST100406-0324 TaxID=1037889 RepID=A0A921TD92_9RHOB|nr:alpha-amylase family glycosyl hydrolase [Profundibacterium mesophilum]KAF0676081.1 Alpha-glucosidase [Profundibacterium mesophilum KAUST100406-0324]